MEPGVPVTHYTLGLTIIATLNPAPPHGQPPPLVWLVNAYRAGEQGQLRALAEALGWPCQEKQLVYRKLAAGTNLLRGSNLNGIEVGKSSPLTAPWPDLILSAGMRNEPVCRWIRNQSGGRSRIVHIGRPWADPERFDLVITTPQYRLPKRDNVLHNTLTLNLVNQVRLASEGERWRLRLNHLPTPHIAVIVGGDSGPYAFGPKAAARLLAAAQARAKELGGSLLITTSARTDPQAATVLAESADVPSYFYRWQPHGADNPYFAFLALADELIVTADSISMLSEACATGKRVWMFDLGVGAGSMSGRPGCPGEGNDVRLETLAYRALMRWGWQRLSRDITLVHKRLVESGRASWLGDLPATGGSQWLGEDMAQALQRVRDLMK